MIAKSVMSRYSYLPSDQALICLEMIFKIFSWMSFIWAEASFLDVWIHHISTTITNLLCTLLFFIMCFLCFITFWFCKFDKIAFLDKSIRWGKLNFARLKSLLFLDSVQCRASLRHMKEDQMKKYEYCLPCEFSTMFGY